MVNCDNIRKITINQLLPNGEVFISTIYFDVVAGEQVTANSVKKCNNIQPIDFSCAITCNPFEESVIPNCWLTFSEECWIDESGNYWEIG